jgi:HEAT repeat protein
LKGETNAKARYEIALAVANFGPAGKEAIPTLFKIIKSSDPEGEEVDNSFSALATIGQASLPTLILLLKQDKTEIRRLALKTIAEMGSKAKSASVHVLPLLKDANREVRLEAIQTLAELRVDSKLALSALYKALDDPVPEVQTAAAATLSVLNVRSDEALRGLIKLLNRDDGDFDFAKVCQCLSQYGKRAQAARPLLLKALGRPDRQAAAVEALRLIDPSSTKAVIISLIRLLGAADPKLRVISARTLATLGEASHRAVPTLLRLFENRAEKVKVRTAAALALSEIAINSPKVVLALRKGLTDPSPIIRIETARAVNRVDPKTLDGVNVLVHILCIEQQAEIKCHALARLREVGLRAKQANAFLVYVVKNQPRPETGFDNSVRIQALSNLALLGGNDPTVMSAFISALKDADSWVVEAAADCLRQRGAAAKDAVAELAKLLKSKETGIRLGSARALKAIGPAASKAIPALREALSDRDVFVRSAAEAALKSIRGRSGK